MSEETLPERIDRKLDRVHERIDELNRSVFEKHGAMGERMARLETKASLMAAVVGTAVAVPVAWITSKIKGES